ncbi:hypothetical protein RHGRI_007721 [Rhododendron griersonianum]|uniref:Uncharacterized protein n=1 Tax=Rhododendron griersonianum TaxID=479676 RepID=A0AAV6KZ89_9ERIC|nr:hypothetical protein RHGRI_007721 [Rhododendron griersonianum]
MGPFHEFFGDQIEFNMGGNLQGKVSSIIDSGGWTWPRIRSFVTQEIMQADPACFVPHQEIEDSVIWSTDPSGTYSSKSAWLAVKQDLPYLDWC